MPYSVLYAYFILLDDIALSVPERENKGKILNMPVHPPSLPSLYILFTLFSIYFSLYLSYRKKED
jgi:hypothetical protein